MKRSGKLKITAVRRLAIRAERSIFRALCPVCDREVEMLTKAHATEILEIDDLAFERMLADGQVHTIQTVSGKVRVCKNSLFTE